MAGAVAPARQLSGGPVPMSPASAAVSLAGANTQAAALMLQQQQMQRQLSGGSAAAPATTPAIGQQLSGGASALPAAMQSASLPQPASPQTLQPPQALGAAQPGAGQPPPAAGPGPSQSSKGLPMSVLLEVIQQHPNLKSRIQEIVSRTDYSEPQKMAAIQRIVREKSPGATLGGSSSGTPPPP